MRSTTTIAVSTDVHRRLRDRLCADLKSLDDVVKDLLEKAEELEKMKEASDG